jgi:hypothetical protein
MLADLLHHVRADLDSAQLRRTIAIYSANLHDETLQASIQTMCAKLLLNLVDRIIKLPDLNDGTTRPVTAKVARVMLFSILDTFRIKFEELNRVFPKQKDEDAMDEDSEITLRQISDKRPIKTISATADSSDPIKGNLCLGFIHLDVRWSLPLQKSSLWIQDITLRITQLQPTPPSPISQSCPMGGLRSSHKTRRSPTLGRLIPRMCGSIHVLCHRQA